MEVTIAREFDTEFGRIYYSFKTIAEWQKVWRVICDMAYDPIATQHESIIVTSENSEKDDARGYGSYTVQNQHLICLDEVWRAYDKCSPFINKKLLKLHVPQVLFRCLGINSWFSFSFPNCEVTYW